jgi:transposase
MAELENMEQRLRQLQRHSNELHGSVQAAFREYRSNLDERRALEAERFEFKHSDKRHAEITAELEQLEAEYKRLDAIYHDMQEKWQAAGALVGACEEFLAEIDARAGGKHQ